MAYKVHDGYQNFRDNEPLILEPGDWSFNEWATICKLCGLPLGQTERIVLHISKLECFVDLNKKIMDSECTYTVIEVCPHCENEIKMRWDTDTMGFKAFCPACGKRLLLCDECRHTENRSPCDYDRQTDSCHRNSLMNQKKGINLMNLSKLGHLMAEYGVCFRAIPSSVRSVVEAQHIDKYPTGKIVFLPEYKREMLVVDSIPEHAGQFLVEKHLGTSSTVRFSNKKFYTTLEAAVSEITGKEQ